MTNALSPANFISVSLLGVPQGLAVPNINTVALFSSEQPSWAAVADYGIYKDPNSVAVDFGSNSKAAAIANSFFSQNPNPIQTSGYLAIIPRKTGVAVPAYATIQDITFQAASSGVGGNSVTVEYTAGGTAGSEVVTVNSSAISVQIASGGSTAAQVAAAIAAYGPAAALVTAHVYGTSSRPQTAPVSPVTLANGSASGTEPTYQAAVRTLNAVYYCGVLRDAVVDANATTLAQWCQANDKLVFMVSSTKTDFQPAGLLTNLATAGFTNARCLYYNDGVAQDTLNFAAAYASRAMSVSFAGSNTTSTLHAKQLVGFVPDNTLSQTDLNVANGNGVDVYPPFGFQGLTPTGELYTSGLNSFFDQVYNQLWLKFALQVAGFNYLAQTATKIPQTETGMEGLKNAYRQVLKQAVDNGMVAPGEWTSGVVFGDPSSLARNVRSIGYYVYSSPVDKQSSADRQARKAPVIQIAAKMGGAIHSSTVIVNVNL